jgi:hypothetical protein
MRQYREHLLFFQPHPFIFKCVSHFQHPQTTDTGLEARIEAINQCKQPETNNLLSSGSALLEERSSSSGKPVTKKP